MEKVLLKDLLFNPAKVHQIAAELGRVHPAFKRAAFERAVLTRFPQLELKARIAWIAECLREHLPDDYPTALDVLVRALPAPNNPELTDNDFGDFIYAPYSEFVARFGRDEQHVDLSLNALREITMRFSAEDAIRYFINAFPERSLERLLCWSMDPNYHVRRLCSEGTRPKLPWSQKLTIPITAPVPILENLFADRTRYVTRSVANHVNDIAKTDPELVIRLLTGWQASGKQRAEEMRFVIKHSLRTLVKQGHRGALTLAGASPDVDVRVSKLRVPAEVLMNSALDFSFVLHARRAADLVVDYSITFQSKSGKASRKVFKLKTCALAEGETVTLSKRHRMRENMTTRKLFRGRHEIEIQINGRKHGKRVFELT